MPESLLSALQDPGNLTVVFQPIFELVDRPDPIHALEATVRGPRGTHFESEDLLLDYVRRKKAESIIDRECVSLVCAAAQTLPTNIRIHINVHLATLTQNPGFVGYFEHRIKDSGLDITHFTVELTDGELDSAAGACADGADAFRRLGVRIGLNNVGMANSAWRLLIERPVDYWKLAPYLAQATSIDTKRRAAVESLLALARKLGAAVVSEAVTTEDNLAALALMGIELVQTDLLCRPISAEHLMRSGVLGSAAPDQAARTTAPGNGKPGAVS
jgi:EAL domain-containing protein (putative c-di-GMP-specific phosphodiesterase class I)